MRTYLRISFVVCLTCSFWGSSTLARAGTLSLENSDRDRLVAAIATTLEERYVDPLEGATLASQITERGANYTERDPVLFAAAVTSDLFILSGDRHLQLSYAPSELPMSGNDTLADQTEVGDLFDNYGISRVEVLSGNVGYLKLTQFRNEPAATERLDAAFTLLGAVDALVLDLRDNRGGNTEFVRYLQGYFFESPRLVMRYQDRGQAELVDTYSARPTGPSQAGLPLFILVNAHTASAAEDFAYSAQAFGYGSVVGETTAGAAHTVARINLENGFVLTVSTGTPVHPVTKSNWNRTGVRPDIDSNDRDGFTVAHRSALSTLIDASQLAHLKARYEWALAPLARRSEVSQSTLLRYIGYYDAGRITYAQGALHYAPTKGPPKVLTPLSKGVFQIEGQSNTRLRFEISENRVFLERIYEDGRIDRFQRIHR